jgi:nucleoid-associated protein YgaU
MPQDDISHLPPDVQASIKAAKEKKTEAGTQEYRPGGKRADAVPYRPQSSKEAKTYVVQPGDSLSKIAKELLGDAARWPEIFELNKDQIKDPNLIHVGQELRLPE